MTRTLLARNLLWFVVGFLVLNLRYGGDAAPGSMEACRGTGLTYQDIDWFAIVNVLDRQQWWRLLSYGFFHRWHFISA